MDGKKKRRVPWHITLFSAGAFFLVFGVMSDRILDGIGLGVLFSMLGALYVFWPGLKDSRGSGSGGHMP